MLEEAEVIYPGHDRPFRRQAARVLGAGGVEHIATRQLVFMGVDLEDPNVSVTAERRPPYVMPGLDSQTLERLGYESQRRAELIPSP